MDTNTAILLLQGRVTLLTSLINASQQELDADNLAISQLQGTLKTQLTSLTPDQLASFPQVVELQTKVADLTASNATIQSQLDDATFQLSDANSQIATLSKPADMTPPVKMPINNEQ